MLMSLTHCFPFGGPFLREWRSQGVIEWCPVLCHLSAKTGWRLCRRQRWECPEGSHPPRFIENQYAQTIKSALNPHGDLCPHRDPYVHTSQEIVHILAGALPSRLGDLFEISTKVSMDIQYSEFPSRQINPLPIFRGFWKHVKVLIYFRLSLPGPELHYDFILWFIQIVPVVNTARSCNYLFNPLKPWTFLTFLTASRIYKTEYKSVFHEPLLDMFLFSPISTHTVYTNAGRVTLVDVLDTPHRDQRCPSEGHPRWHCRLPCKA